MGVQKRYAQYIKFFVYLIVVILINVAGMSLFFRIDLTGDRIYSISAASKKVVSALSEPLTINVFFTKDLPAPYNNTERYLHDLLEEYAVYANHYFNYRFYDVSHEAEMTGPAARENQKLAENYGIHPVQIQVFEEDEVKFKKAYMGLVMIHGDMIEKIPAITAINGLEYKLTTTMQKLNNKISAMLGLTGKIAVKLYLSSSLTRVAPLMGIDALSEFPGRLEKIVDKLNEKNYGKLVFSYIDPSMDPTAEPALKKYNLMRLEWPAIDKGKVPAGSGVIGLVMEYKNKAREVPLLNVLRIPIIGTQYKLADLDQMEETINANLETLVDINENIGYLADHGTLETSDFSPMGRRRNPEALANFADLVSQTYTIKPVSLGQAGVPAGLNCLIVARPTKKFSDYELYQIDQALMHGTNLALFLDAFEEIRPQNQQNFAMNRGPSYVPLDTGLEKLLAHYGIHIEKSYVMDKNCHQQRLPQNMGSGETPIYFAPIIQNKFIRHDLPFMKNIRGLVAVKISPLQVDEKQIAENQLKAYKLFSSSEKSWEIRDRINFNPLFISPPADTDLKSYALAYLLEGAFPSYFADKSIPEKPLPDTAGEAGEQKSAAAAPTDQAARMDLSKVTGHGGFMAKGRPGKIFLMASSEMLKDNVMDPNGQSPNDMFIMNVLDVLNQREDIAVMRSKVQQFNPLHDVKGPAKNFVKTFNIAGLPILVVLVGLLVWLRRRARQKRIEFMFQR